MKILPSLIASSFEVGLAEIPNPPITSLASAKGPSITFRLPPEARMRAPLALGISPPVLEEDARLRQLGAVLGDRLHQLLLRRHARFVILVALDHHHIAHRRLSYSFAPTCSKNSQARTSMPQPTCAPRLAAGCFEAISTASSMFFASTMKNAPTISFASVKGPSVTVGLSPPGRIDFQY